MCHARCSVRVVDSVSVDHVYEALPSTLVTGYPSTWIYSLLIISSPYTVMVFPFVVVVPTTLYEYTKVGVDSGVGISKVSRGVWASKIVTVLVAGIASAGITDTAASNICTYMFSAVRIGR
ncbi:uncharacterized protein C8R40DRAFT_601837 [Lentinula edodes]|uniref:uncharacterized protein n=1 Tax=Lentinula edodes TaxID=5353 RepID=UPI001E8D1478|nr:uncharacterized protein C8R40DRAFT_601837 [Lentinula edodes]KAH7879451.1 hypothetical protein C8R40DRAFT_601837 [Lentinula edodes]